MNNDLNNIVSAKIKELCKIHHISSAEFAEKCDMSGTDVEQIISGTRELSTDELIKITEVFEVSSDYMLGRSLYPIPYPKTDNDWNLQRACEIIYNMSDEERKRAIKRMEEKYK